MSGEVWCWGGIWLVAEARCTKTGPLDNIRFWEAVHRIFIVNLFNWKWMGMRWGHLSITLGIYYICTSVFCVCVCVCICLISVLESSGQSWDFPDFGCHKLVKWLYYEKPASIHPYHRRSYRILGINQGVFFRLFQISTLNIPLESYRQGE